MTKQEKIIVSAYTGVLMCDFDDVHEYIQKKLDRQVFTHELADKDIQKEIEEKSKEDFLKICNREEPERKKGKWIYGEKSGLDGWYCSECGGFIPWDYVFYGLDNIDFIEEFKTCPFCDSKMVSYTGADMKEGEESE